MDTQDTNSEVKAASVPEAGKPDDRYWLSCCLCADLVDLTIETNSWEAICCTLA